MSNEKIILKFINRESGKTPAREIINGYYSYRGSTLTSTGSQLINYSTVIASWNKNGSINLNIKKYSVTTSKIQQLIKRLCKEKNILINEKMEDLK